MVEYYDYFLQPPCSHHSFIEHRALNQDQQLGGSVCAWCWILVDSGRFLTKI